MGDIFISETENTTQERKENNMNKWYAVQRVREDAWDNGSFDYNEAVAMLKAQGE